MNKIFRLKYIAHQFVNKIFYIITFIFGFITGLLFNVNFYTKIIEMVRSCF
ncbi:MAG: hypothetical protein HFI87_02110 [Bacilli bacterium]|nr:hypothetical protein [Bacilli bacterium]